MSEHIYVAGTPEGPVKIGFSNNPRSRINALNCASPQEIRLLHCYSIDCNPTDIERTIHFMLRDERMSGEWFNICADQAFDALRKTAEIAGVSLIDARPNAVPPEVKEPVKQPQPGRRGRGRPASGKERVTILLDPDILASYRATGKGWQSRLNDDLRKARNL